MWHTKETKSKVAVGEKRTPVNFERSTKQAAQQTSPAEVSFEKLSYTKQERLVVNKLVFTQGGFIGCYGLILTPFAGFLIFILRLKGL